MTQQHRINCILLEWSEEQQVFHLNDVVNGVAFHLPETCGFNTVYVAGTYDEARLFLRYIDKFTKRNSRSKDDIKLSTIQVKTHIKALVKFAKDYTRMCK